MRALIFRLFAALAVMLGERLHRTYRAAARLHYQERFLACGDGVSFDPLTSRIDYEQVRVGSRVYIGPGATIGRADIGNDVMLGPNVSVRDGYHAHDIVGRTMRDSGDASRGPGRVEIGDDVWIGEGAVLLRRARIGQGAVVGTKAMVNEPVAPYTIVGGMPARPIGSRFTDDELSEHLRRRGASAEEIEAVVTERRAALSGPDAAPDDVPAREPAHAVK
jgi:acetyltransferase-like isoleucine patch superfamily enzyme